jgi:myo-inositol-1(or 4)-monophosphatase
MNDSVALASIALESLRPQLSSILEQAIPIARGAGEILRAGFAQVAARCTALDLRFKSTDFDPVTEYDHRSEAFIVASLQRAFPEHHILGEEGGTYAAAEASDGELCFEWHVDPLDGTVNFAHGFPAFAVSLGLLVNGWPALGVVYDPIADELFSAAHGLGATLNGRPIRVSTTDTLARALLNTGFPYDCHASEANNFAHFIAFQKCTQGVRRVGSAALDLCMVACGRVDGYWELKIKPHDIAAGIVIVREAGGVVTDFGGGQGMFALNQIVASNGLLHAAMLNVLSA